MKTFPLVSLLLAGCIDTSARLDEFFDRSEPFRVTVAAGECTERFDVSGEYLLAVGIVVNPAAPILFDASFEVDSEWSLTMTMQPLAVADRSPVGEPFSATGTIAEDGTFTVDFGEITIVGEANAILPGVPAIARLALEGCTSSPTSSCGNAAGDIVQPAQIPLAGSTYGAVVVDGDIATKPPLSACPTP